MPCLDDIKNGENGEFKIKGQKKSFINFPERHENQLSPERTQKENDKDEGEQRLHSFSYSFGDSRGKLNSHILNVSYMF